VTDAGLKPRSIKRVAVLGGGLMGSGIATACILNGIDVLLKEVNQKFLDAGLGRIQANLASRVKKGRMSEAAAKAAMARVKGALDYSDFGGVDMVIEAAIEDVGLKQNIFADLERACRKDAILASNTSTISLDLVSAKTHAADRIVGAHFFSPAHIMPLLEIVRTDRTSKQVILDTLEFGSRIRKTPVVVGNCTGFAVNRVFFPYTQAACMLVDLGLDPYRVDKAIAGFGMPMGPFRLSDLVGADVGLHVGMNILESFPERCYPARIIQLLNERKTLGEKTGSGFYKYDARRRPSPNPDLLPVVQQARKLAGLMKEGTAPPKFSEKDIVEFIFFPVVNEGCRVIDEGIVDKPADLDVAMVMGMGFPAFRGGLIFWADLMGAEYIRGRLAAWAQQFAAAGLDGFFKPSAYLESCARSGAKLSAGKNAASKM
jgi:enoyl-CoA hydratase/3-hydroxyacyl-CoA dehydrogenase